MHLSALLQFPLTALLESIYLFGIKLHSLKYPPNMLALSWQSTPAYYAFDYAGIFDADLMVTIYHVQLDCSSMIIK